MKARRQAAVVDLVSREPIRSQEQLRQRLFQQGFDVTQATLSRDIKELGLMKRASDGSYQPAPDDDTTATATDAARHLLQRALVLCQQRRLQGRRQAFLCFLLGCGQQLPVCRQGRSGGQQRRGDAGQAQDRAAGAGAG